MFFVHGLLKSKTQTISDVYSYTQYYIPFYLYFLFIIEFIFYNELFLK